MKKILFVTNMEQTAALLQDALEKVQKQYPETVSGQVCYLQSDVSWENVWEKTFTDMKINNFSVDGYWVKYEIFNQNHQLFYNNGR